MDEPAKDHPTTVVLSGEHAAEGKQLQANMSKFEREFKATVEAFWKEKHARPEAETQWR